MPHALRDCRVDRIFGDVAPRAQIVVVAALAGKRAALHLHLVRGLPGAGDHLADPAHRLAVRRDDRERTEIVEDILGGDRLLADTAFGEGEILGRSEEHTSELQSLMRISYAVFCLKKKKTTEIYKF